MDSMGKTYEDFITAAADAKRDGHEIKEAVITEETAEGFFTDGRFNEEHEKNNDYLGQFSIALTIGDGDYVLTESDERYPL